LAVRRLHCQERSVPFLGPPAKIAAAADRFATLAELDDLCV
jgi:hypothetical protein